MGSRGRSTLRIGSLLLLFCGESGGLVHRLLSWLFRLGLLALLLYLFDVLFLVELVRQRDQNVLLAVELGDLGIALRELRDDVIDKPLQWLVSLWNIRIRDLYRHVFLLEVDTVPEHLHSQVLVKVCVGTLRVFGTAVLWDVSRATRFRQQVVFFFTGLTI